MPRNPYHVLVSELMLQQTQVTRVLPKFEHFVARWPTIQDLANARLAEVVTEWKGLGYNRRAKFLLETAKIVTHTYGGVFPKDRETLSALPGFGPYMVSALRVFAFGAQESVIDVNVSRVLSRIETGSGPVSAKEIQEITEQNIPKNRADEWHQALMDFGATVCRARVPTCTDCPVSRICAANTAAKGSGTENFATWLALHPVVKKVSPKDSGKRFEETDRYFRGRIIDYLREGQRPMRELRSHILVDHKLENVVRFGALVESLVVDGLIRVSGTMVTLA